MVNISNNYIEVSRIITFLVGSNLYFPWDRTRIGLKLQDRRLKLDLGKNNWLKRM